MIASERRVAEYVLSLPRRSLRERVEFMRSLAWSLQRIADYEGVSFATIQRAAVGMPAPRQRKVRKATRQAG
jgi:hypothetical protein